MFKSKLLPCLCAAAFTFAVAPAAPAAVINSYQPFVQTFGTTQTDVVTGAKVSFFDAYENSSVNVTGGDISWLTLRNFASATISGGDISWLQVFENSTADITGIFDLSWLVVGTGASVTIHADNVKYSNGNLSGIWGNGTSFNFWAVAGAYNSPSTIPPSLLPNIKIVSTRVSIPEPASIALLVLGLAGFAFANRKKQRV